MTSRVILGANTSAYGGGEGLWVSKPSKSATSTDRNDFLVAPGINNALGALTGSFVAGTDLPLVSSTEIGNIQINSFGDYNTEWTVVFGLYIPHGLGFTPMVWSDVQDSMNASGPEYSWYTGSEPGFYIGSVSPSSSRIDNAYLYITADDTNVGVEIIGVYISYTTFGSGSSYTTPSSMPLLQPIHYAVMNAQVA